MARSPRVAIVGCRSAPDAVSESLYPDVDRLPLSEALTTNGAAVSALAWDDENVDWSSFDAAVVRSTWDSVDRPEEFLRWAASAARATRLLNPLPILRWNLDKSYLQDLEQLGVATVPTTWVTDISQWSPPPTEFVIKPSISGGGRHTARYGAGQIDQARAHVSRVVANGRAAMVQPHMSSVETVGELKVVFIGDRYSHTMRVGPLLTATGRELVRPWEHQVAMERIEPSAESVELARDVLGAVRALMGMTALYARVDLIEKDDASMCVAEVELIDPALFLSVRPGAASELAELILSP